MAQGPVPPQHMVLTIREALETALNLHMHGDTQRAASMYRQVLERDPHNPDALHLLGVMAEQEGRHDLAVQLIGRAIALQPRAPQYHRNLAVALRGLGDLAATLGCLREALHFCPDDAPLHRLLGEVLQLWGDLPGAATAFAAAHRLIPSDGRALRDLGNVLTAQGDIDGALRQYQAAQPLIPTDPDLQNSLGMALSRLGRLPEALAAYEQALRLRPDAAVLEMHLVYLRQELCAWKGLEQYRSHIRSAVISAPHELISPFMFLTMPSTGVEQLTCARNWATNRYAAFEAGARAHPFVFSPGPRQRLHLGYLSTDFRDHAVANLIVELFECHDRAHFKVSAYSMGPDDGGSLRRRITAAVDRFVDISGDTSVAAAQIIHADQVDILLDLNGYTSGARSEILALRPAPVQANYLGYPGTMGAGFVDYLIADRFIVPLDQAALYSERLAYLPDAYQPNDRRRIIAAETPTRAACGLPEGGMVFCSFNQPYKIQPDVFAVWLRLLAATPGSVLWLLEGSQWASDNLRREAQKHSVDPQRLVFAPRRSMSEHLARQRLADLFLDTLPVNAHTTCSDALWVGLPVVTCAGETFVSRVAGSLLRAAGLPELVTHSLEEYETLALALAHDSTRLAHLKKRLLANLATQPLFDTVRYARNIEALYRKMWAEYCGAPEPALTHRAPLVVA